MSAEEYLGMERNAGVKHEYVEGQMFAMSGGTLAHSQIPLNIAVALKRQPDGKGCGVSNSDLRIQISPSGPFVYPDLSIYCGEPQLADNQRDCLLNPTVIFEVLSKSTEAYDRGQKFAHYRRVRSLRDYVLISQSEPRIEVFSRGESGPWVLAEFVGLEAICLIPGVGCEIPLAEVYRDVRLEAA